MARLRRYILDGHCYHVTTVTRDRRPVFADPACIGVVLESLHFLRSAGRTMIFAYVVMPDHVHLLVVPREEVSISDIMHSFKTFVARSGNKLNRSSGALWQQSFHDRVIRSEEHLRRTIDYIHRNSVVAGLVARAEDYPYSSASPGADTDLQAFLDE